mgnify:CR=1 FL=1
MPASIAARGAVGIRKEASFASGGGIDSWQVVESASLNKTIVNVYQDVIRSSPDQIAGRAAHTLVAGQIVFPVSPANPTQWFECGIGGTGPFTPQRPLSSMAIEIQEGNIGTIYSSGDVISRLEFSSRQGEILRCTATIEGQDLSQRAAGTVSFASGDDPYLHSEAVFTLDGVTNSDVVAFSVGVDNNPITDLTANTFRRRDIPVTKAVVTGTISIIFTDTTLRNRFFNNLPSRITAEYRRASKEIQFDLNNIKYDSSERPLEGQTAYILETLNFTAFVNNPTSENSLSVTIT